MTPNALDLTAASDPPPVCEAVPALALSADLSGAVASPGAPQAPAAAGSAEPVKKKRPGNYRAGRVPGAKNKRQTKVIGLRLTPEVHERLTLWRELTDGNGAKLIARTLEEMLDRELGKLLAKPFLRTSPAAAKPPTI